MFHRLAFFILESFAEDKYKIICGSLSWELCGKFLLVVSGIII
jgi:hypothetical protein